MRGLNRGKGRAVSASLAAAAAMAGSLAVAPGALAAQNMNDLISFTVSPDPWNELMQGKTASVTVTGKTDAQVPLALLSYKTTGPTVGPMHIGPQKLHDIDRVTVSGRETKTLQVDIPNCFYQVDFVDAANLTQKEIEVAQFANGWIKAVVGGDTKCDYDPFEPNPDPEYPPPPPVNPDPDDKQNPYVPPVLPPVGGGTAGGAGNPVVTPRPTVRACTAVTARSYRVRAKQRNTITVRVKTTSSTKPTVRLRGAGVKASKRVSSKGTAVFRVTPRRAGSIRVTATGCAKVANVRVLSAKRSQRSGSAPTFTG